MSGDSSILKKYVGGKPAIESALEAMEGDSLEDLGAFGWLRGVRDRAIMLELRHKDGSVTAFGYAWLKQAKFNASGEITLDFSGETVKITGRNLNSPCRPNVRLLDGILRHRVPWIQEADGATEMESLKDATVIERLEAK